jgi:hypothetical protein
MNGVSKFTMLFAVSLLAALPPADAVAAGRDRLLSLVPTDAVSVGMLGVDDMRRSATVQTILRKIGPASLDLEAERLLRQAGLNPAEDVDVVMVAFSPSTSGDRPRVIVAASGRFDPERLARFAEGRGAIRRGGAGSTYFLAPEAESRPGEQPAVSFPDRGLVLAGTEDAIVSTLAALSRGGHRFLDSPLGRELSRIDRRASGWMLIDVQRASGLRERGMPGATPFGVQAFAAMKNISKVALWAAETSEGVEFGSMALTSDAETRGLVEDFLKGILATWRMAAQERQPELVKVVRRFSVSSNGNAVTLTGSVPAAMINDFAARIHP